MLARLRERLMHALGKEEGTEEAVFVPVVKDGRANIVDPEQIPETYCDTSAKDTGECYLGLRTGTIYVRVHPWELND